jgi:hypothetical protein
MIDQMVQDALKRINEYINRAAAQNMRRMREGK